MYGEKFLETPTQTGAFLGIIERRINEEHTMDERIITEREEEAIRLCHHDHGGYCADDAARIMGITPKEVKALLRLVKRKAPQLFPMLTPRQQTILRLYDQQLDRVTIAKLLGITIIMLAKDIRFLRRHKFLVNNIFVRYEPNKYDDQVKERF